VVRIAREVAVDRDPVHFLADQYFILAYDAYVILRLAADDAGAAADAGVKVDRHAPVDAGHYVFGIECAVLAEALLELLVLGHFLRRCRAAAVGRAVRVTVALRAL